MDDSRDLASRIEDAADPGDPSRRSFIQAGAGVVVGAAALVGAGRQLRILRSESSEPAGSVTEREATYADLELRINGQTRAVRVPHQRTLLLALREDLGLTGTKKSCNLGQCGACTVLMDGLPVYSCMLLALDAVGRDLMTIEGVEEFRSTTPAARGVHPPYGEPVWTLHAWHDHVWPGTAAAEPAALAERRSPRAEWQPVPLRQLSE